MNVIATNVVTSLRELTSSKQLPQVVKGSGGSIFALGDAATIQEDKALDHAAELFRRVCNAAPACRSAALPKLVKGDGSTWVGL